MYVCSFINILTVFIFNHYEKKKLNRTIIMFHEFMIHISYESSTLTKYMCEVKVFGFNYYSQYLVHKIK